jgi:hypothetical protein
MIRRVRTIAAQLLIFLVLGEAAAVAVHYYDTHQWYYRHHRQYPLIGETARGELAADVLHPYFGPIHRVGVRPRTNNIGFDDEYRYPFRRVNDRQFVVGIFGGSVGWYFCDRAVPRFVASLRTDPALAGREIVPLCFAHEGYKQPQQLLVLAYFLSVGQSFDAVINLDGFNEVALGAQNDDRGRDISMPSPMHLDPIINVIDRSTLTPDAIESLAAISRAKSRLNWLAPRAAAARSALAGLIYAKLYEFTRQRYASELARFADVSAPVAPDASMVQITPSLVRRERDQLYTDIAAGWESSSLLMHDMLAARGIRYLHVLQPNQYASRHRFGADEARVALNPSSPFKPPVERGYAALRQAGSRLVSRVAFVDATTLFDDEREAVYEDDCCHYTQRGNDLIGAFVASHLRQLLAH